MSQNVSKKNVVLLSTHIVNEFVLQKYRKLYNDLGKDYYEIILLLNMDDGDEWDIPDDVVCALELHFKVTKNQ